MSYIAKTTSIFFLFFLIIQSFYCQNLVLNNSFETNNGSTFPPPDFSNGDIDNWTAPTSGTPDYLNTANTGLFAILGAPSNSFGNQSPNTGNAYGGFIAYEASGGEYREYVQGQLSQPLNTGDTICVEFYISLAENGTEKVDELGIYISDTTIGGASSDFLPYNPQITANASQLNDFNNWVLISGSYIAGGGEQYITIGNFNSNANTTVTPNPATPTGLALNGIAYYYVDDVSLTICSTVDSNTVNNDTTNQDSTNNDTTITPLDSLPSLSIPNIITPNNDGKNEVFLIENLIHYPNTSLKIFNRWGSLVFETSNYLNDWKGKDNKGNTLSEGVYYFILTNEQSSIIEKGTITITY